MWVVVNNCLMWSCIAQHSWLAMVDSWSAMTTLMKVENNKAFISSDFFIDFLKVCFRFKTNVQNVYEIYHLGPHMTFEITCVYLSWSLKCTYRLLHVHTEKWLGPTSCFKVIWRLRKWHSWFRHFTVCVCVCVCVCTRTYVHTYIVIRKMFKTKHDFQTFLCDDVRWHTLMFLLYHLIWAMEQ